MLVQIIIISLRKNMTKDEYMNAKGEKCERCHEPKLDVKLRIDPFVREGIVLGPKVKWCNKCYNERNMDV